MKQQFPIKISIAFIVFLLVLVILVVFQTQFFRLKPVKSIPEYIENELQTQGANALSSQDVPVGAVVLFDGEIIGRGYNTVYRDTNIAAHAEINAINDAIKNIGLEVFLKSDRSKIAIISTYEPCEMCKGMLNHYRISNVMFLKDKSYYRWLKNHVAGLKYEFSKRKVGREKLQDSLFLLHPDYPGK